MEQLSTTDVADLIAEKHELSKKGAKEILNTVLETIVSSVKEDKKVVFLGFGSFEKAHRKERTGTNPSTGEKMLVAATDYPKFKVGASFKKAVK